MHVNGAAFEHDPLLRGGVGSHFGKLQKSAYSGRDLIVLLPIWVLRPGVESPISEHELRFWIVFWENKDRPGIARPDAVRGAAVQTHRVAESVRVLQDLAGLFLDGLSLGQDFDALVTRQVPHDLRIHPTDRLEFSRPIVAVMRPRDPGGL